MSGLKDFERKVYEHESTTFVEDYVNLECDIELCHELTALWEYINANRKFHDDNKLSIIAHKMKRKICGNISLISWMRDIAFYANKKIANHYMRLYYETISKNNGNSYISTKDLPNIVKQ